MKENFKLVEASKLSLDDEFMRSAPRDNEAIQPYISMVEDIIAMGMKDFYAPIYAPSFNKNKTGVQFVAGEYPAINMSYAWWKNAARRYDHKHGSRLGTESEYIAFLAVLIKQMVEELWPVDGAWRLVCCCSYLIGHCWDSTPIEGMEHQLEKTGVRERCGFYDLGNTFRIIDKDESDDQHFVLAGSCYRFGGDYFPLLSMTTVHGNHHLRPYHVGWIIIPA